MKRHTFIPVNGKVIIKPTTPKNMVGNLVLPTQKEERRPDQGIVVSKAKDVELTVKKGDLVLYDKYNTDAYEFEGQKFVIISSHDIHAIIT